MGDDSALLPLLSNEKDPRPQKSEHQKIEKTPIAYNITLLSYTYESTV